MGYQVKCENQCSTLILQKVFRALSLPLSQMLWLSLPKLEKGALLFSINIAAPLPEGAGQGPQVRTFRLVLQCGPGP